MLTQTQNQTYVFGIVQHLLMYSLYTERCLLILLILKKKINTEKNINHKNRQK